MKKTILLANAPINTGNRGCVALSLSALKIIDDIFKAAGQEYEIYLLDSKITGKDVCDYNAYGFKTSFKICQYIPYNLTTFAKSILLPHITIKSFNIFSKADFILDIGQGDSFADIYGDWRFKNIDRIHKQARLFGKPYCLLPQTIGPFTDEKKKKKAIKSLKRASLVMARDKQSYDYVKNTVPSQNNVKDYIDVAFYLPYEKNEFSNNYINVGLNISSLLWHGGYSKNNQFGLKDEYKETIVRIVDYFISQSNICLHLIPHVVLSERHNENDYEVCYDLWRKYKHPRLVLAPFALGPIEIKSYIAGMDFFMGARMHATIAAFSSGVPVVPMAYSRKFNGLFVETLRYTKVADLKNMSQYEILTVIREAFEKREELKLIIEDRIAGVVSEKKEILYADLRKFLIK